jgi:signal transduction histidine kinase
VLAVGLALASLWHNVRAQVALAAKKDEFISAVSHELRTPLTSIRMYAEMLEKNWVKSADKLTGYYRTMRQESERLSRLVENVLDFARLQKGRKRYTFELGDIDACVAAVVEMMRPYAEQRGFVIQAHLEPLGETSFDRDAVTQIVVNLIDNAVKYAAGAADKTISIRTRGAADYTIIEVEDHGPGIPHRQRKKVFEQFYRYGPAPAGREPGSARSPTTGTGLGLTLVKRFAEAHGGYVEILSAEPAGVILRVALPAPARQTSS